MICSFIFSNSHQTTCLRLQAILKPGSGRWKKGTFPRETSRAQSWVLKQMQTNNSALCLEILLCLSVSHTTPHSSRSLPNPRAKTSPVTLHDSQSHYQRKLNFESQSTDALTDDVSVKPAGSSNLDGSVSFGSCCGTVPWRLSVALKMT